MGFRRLVKTPPGAGAGEFPCTTAEKEAAAHMARGIRGPLAAVTRTVKKGKKVKIKSAAHTLSVRQVIEEMCKCQ
jgi:hypothetical protein